MLSSTSRFVGWIPCISGRLLFRYFSCAHPRATNNLEVNHREQQHKSIYRYVILSSQIDWEDEHESDLTDGVFQLIVAGWRNESQPHFHGFVFLSPLEKAKASSTWISAKDDIDKIHRAAIKNQHIGELFQRLTTQLCGHIDDEFYAVRFNITDRGFAFLEYEQAAGEVTQTIHNTTICRQAFYFLKYSLHKHQHHHQDDDSLTTIHPLPKKPERIGPLLIDDLRRGLVEMKRRLDALQYESLYQARGVVSYTKSLVESSYAEGYLTQADYSRYTHYFENIGESLTILAERRQRDTTRRLEASNHSRSWILFWIAVFGPLVIVFKEQIVANIHGTTNTSTYTVKLVSTILGSDLNFIATVILVISGYVLNLAFRSKWPEPMRRIKGGYYLIETIVKEPFKAKLVASVILFIAAVLIGFSVFAILP